MSVDPKCEEMEIHVASPPLGRRLGVREPSRRASVAKKEQERSAEGHAWPHYTCWLIHALWLHRWCRRSDLGSWVVFTGPSHPYSGGGVCPPQEGNLPEFKEKVHFITLLFPQSCFLSSPGDLRIGFTSHECLFEMELELELQNRGVPG